MTLVQILDLMCDTDNVVVNDYDLPIDNMTVFEGTVKECKNQNINGTVCTLVAGINDTMYIMIEKGE